MDFPAVLDGHSRLKCMSMMYQNIREKKRLFLNTFQLMFTVSVITENNPEIRYLGMNCHTKSKICEPTKVETKHLY